MTTANGTRPRIVTSRRSTTPRRFTKANRRARRRCSKSLACPREPGIPLFGFVGRLADQKGVDLIVGTMQEWVRSRDAQWVLLGTGEPKHHQALTQLAERFPDKVAIKLAFSNEWAHRSRPGRTCSSCPANTSRAGSTNLYSLKYGTVPVVRATGGLVDTICSVTPETIEAEVATGFSFRGLQHPGTLRDAERGVRVVLPTRGLAQHRPQRHVARLVVDPQRSGLCRTVSTDDQSHPPCCVGVTFLQRMVTHDRVEQWRTERRPGRVAMAALSVYWPVGSGGAGSCGPTDGLRPNGV